MEVSVQESAPQHKVEDPDSEKHFRVVAVSWPQVGSATFLNLNLLHHRAELGTDASLSSTPRTNASVALESERGAG